MSYEERMAKIKAERQQFIDVLLTKILALPKVQEYIKDFRTGETEISGVETEYDYEQSALEDFFQSDPGEILAVPEIWEEVREHLKEEFEDDLSDLKWFLSDGLYFDAKKEFDKKIEELQSEFEDALKRKHNRDKYGKPIPK